MTRETTPDGPCRSVDTLACARYDGAAMIYQFRQPEPDDPAPPARKPTPAERALLTHAGPVYIEAAEFGPPESTLSAEVAPDDWRLYYLMRELPEPDRARVLAFAELLYNLRHAQRWAAGEPPAGAV